VGNGRLNSLNRAVFNVFMSRALTERLPPASPIVINSVNPGYCASELRRNTPFPLKQIFKFFDSLIARTNAEGASTIVWAALAGTAGEPSSDLRDRLRGAYSNDWKVGEASDYVLSEKGNTAQERIWVSHLEVLLYELFEILSIIAERDH
jgi:retinol dehydrogenase 12